MEVQLLKRPHTAALQVRAAKAGDAEALVDVWRRSVVAAYDFLAPGALPEIEGQVRRELATVPELWLAESGGRFVGFIGCDGGHVGMLFVAPDWFRRGVGSLLLAHARRRHGPLWLEVNEDYPAGLAFYRARGFVVTGRSPVDSEGRPYPLLHLRQEDA